MDFSQNHHQGLVLEGIPLHRNKIFWEHSVKYALICFFQVVT